MDGQVQLNDMGQMVHDEWALLPNRFPNIAPDAFIVMPNHIHGVIIITDIYPAGSVLSVLSIGTGHVPVPTDNTAPPSNPTVGASPSDPTVGEILVVSPTVGQIVEAFKSITTVRYIHGVKHHGWPPFRGRLWQRNYYEHIIRSEESLNRIRKYIYENPLRWNKDRNHPPSTQPKPEKP